MLRGFISRARLISGIACCLAGKACKGLAGGSLDLCTLPALLEPLSITRMAFQLRISLCLTNF